jgi:hypothetical protein
MIVVFIAILVMDNFFGPKSAANKLFNYKYVFTNIAVRIGSFVFRPQQQFVAVLNDKRPSCVVRKAFTRAIPWAVISASPDDDVAPTLVATTNSAFDLTSHGTKVLNRYGAWRFTKAHTTSRALNVWLLNAPSSMCNICQLSARLFRNNAFRSGSSVAVFVAVNSSTTKSTRREIDLFSAVSAVS